MLVLWGEQGKIGGWYDPVAIWRQYCTAEVTGGSVPSGHFLAEEAPAETLAWFERFF
jgi:haloacetate dehalogenase